VDCNPRKVMTLEELLRQGKSFGQGASNAAASTVTGPVDMLAWLLRKGGVDVGEAPIGGEAWMRQKGLMATPENRLAGLLGEGAGLAAPIVAAAKAPQIAGGLLQMGRNLATPQTMNKQAGQVFVYPQEKALAIAQKNAALPIEKGGLGLHPNNTAAERAKAMGFADDAYHGTGSEVQQIDKTMFGSATGANSAKRAFWAASDPTTAAGYADYAAKSAPVRKLVEEANTFERIAQKGRSPQVWWDKYDDALKQADELERSIYENPLRGQNVMPLNVNTRNAKYADAAGAEFVDMEGGVNQLLRDAKLSKSDVAVLENLADDVGRNARPTTHYGVLNPAALRSRFAAFDPARRNEADLLGRADPKLLSLLAAGGLLGTAGYNKAKAEK